MAINTQTIRIDLNTGRTIPVAFAHQNDTNRQLTFQLYNNGVAFTPSSTTVKFAYKSPIVNGRYSVITGSQMASGTVSGNTVTVTLPAAYTQVSGVGLLTMILTTSGNTLRPVNIKFVCQGSADGDDQILNASDWPEGLYDYMDNWLEENEPTEIANLKSDLDGLFTFAYSEERMRISEKLFYYPFVANTGDVVIVETISGNAFGAAYGLFFCDSNKEVLETRSVYPNLGNTATFTIEHDGIAYLRPNNSLAETLLVIKKTDDGFNAAGRIVANENSIEENHSELINLQEITTDNSSNIFTTEYEIGAINSSGIPSTSNNTIRTKDFIEVDSQKTYTMYNGRDIFGAVVNPTLYINEYDENGAFLRRSSCYVSYFTTGENTKKIKFCSNSGTGVAESLAQVNNTPIQINRGNILLEYEKAGIILPPESSCVETKKENLFHGCYDFDTIISSGTLNYWGNNVQVVTLPIDVDSETIYFALSNRFTAFPLAFVQCYDENGSYLGQVNSSIPNVGTETFIKASTLISGTKTIIFNSAGYQKNDATAYTDYESFKEEVLNYLVVSPSFDLIKTRLNFSHSNKIISESAEVNFVKKILNNRIRDFVLTAIESTEEEINVGGYDLVIPIMTDIHTFWDEPYAILDYFSRSGYCDMVCNLGDNVPDHYATKAETIAFLTDIFSISNTVPHYCDVVNIQGNHDTNPVNATISDGTNMVKNNVFYSLSKERMVDGFVSSKNYGYIDIENAKVRVVFLDTSDIFASDGTPIINGNNTLIQQEQLDWLCNDALVFDKADKNEWSVITMAHDRLTSVASDDLFGKLFDAFSSGTALNMNATRTADGVTINLAVDVDFSQQGEMTYICHINGHIHEDNIIEFGNGFKQISIPTDTGTAYYYNGETRTAYTRAVGTIQEHCFDILCLNKKTSSVLLKRIGVGSDRAFTY